MRDDQSNVSVERQEFEFSEPHNFAHDFLLYSREKIYLLSFTVRRPFSTEAITKATRNIKVSRLEKEIVIRKVLIKF